MILDGPRALTPPARGRPPRSRIRAVRRAPGPLRCARGTAQGPPPGRAQPSRGARPLPRPQCGARGGAAGPARPRYKAGAERLSRLRGRGCGARDSATGELRGPAAGTCPGRAALRFSLAAALFGGAARGGWPRSGRGCGCGPGGFRGWCRLAMGRAFPWRAPLTCSLVFQ